ncbi:hypothetical protein SBOR_8909 [Sclerotinia borealis F-4128]|uniref:lipoyl(octanoyl) transferase n=1 Tax=Sclerotinia borealis (strain F-4128) TaxID=1432307 RepID=W9C813_SCLBF|nr:hypothetical protein SBOR_8909 [Sclerotinia borealis F-4128]
MITSSQSPVPSGLIRHIHLRGITPFHIAQIIQSTLVSNLLEYKKKTSISQHAHPKPPAPIPTILTFQPTPVFTTGRRELKTPLSETLLKALREPLTPISTSHLPTIRKPFTTSKSKEQIAEIIQTPRGGLVTFHGPGQLVIYPVLDLLTFPNLGPRCYVNLLEETTIRCLRGMDLDILGRTDNPGVWVNEGEKIASLGVHLRRNVTSYGIGLNMILERGWWDRIKACGLDDKRIVGIDELLKDEEKYQKLNAKLGPSIKDELKDGRSIAQWWVRQFAEGLGSLGRGEKCDESDTAGQSGIESQGGSFSEDEDVRERKDWTGWGDIPEEVKQLIPMDIRGGNELKLSTNGGFVQYQQWR